jgi:hypothetical protein
MNCDKHTNWLHLLVRLRGLSLVIREGSLGLVWEKVRGQGILTRRARKKSEETGECG